MDGVVFIKWFDEIFYPQVRARTRRPVLLLLDNAPGHQNEFVRENVRVKFFPPNMTSWRQPMDMGIIAAVKKRYKYLMIKDILAFHDLPEDVKNQRKRHCETLRRGAAGVYHGKPANVLDAAHYILEAWNTTTATTILNCFVKADIIRSLDARDTDTTTEGVDEIVALLQSSSLCGDVDEATLVNEVEQVLTADNEDSEEWRQTIVEEVEDCLQRIENLDFPIAEDDVIDGEIESEGEIYDDVYEDEQKLDFEMMLHVLGCFHNAIKREERSINDPNDADLQQCKDICHTLERKIGHYMSKKVRIKQQRSKQLTLNDCTR